MLCPNPSERLFCRQQKLTSFLQGLPFLRQSIGGGPGRLFRAARLPLLQPQLMQKTRGALTGAACRSPLCRRTWLDSGGVRLGDRNGGACIKFTARCLESAQCRRKPGAMRRQISPTTAKKNKRTSGEVLRFAAPPSANSLLSSTDPSSWILTRPTQPTFFHCFSVCGISSRSNPYGGRPTCRSPKMGLAHSGLQILGLAQPRVRPLIKTGAARLFD